jgi:rhodanese-related sulfurtransferase
MFQCQELDAGQLQELLSEQSENIALIDVRTPTEAAHGGIPGARNIPLQELAQVAHELPGEKHLVFYCHSGRRSAEACAFLSGRGRVNVFHLRGGMIGWLQSGQAVSRELD